MAHTHSKLIIIGSGPAGYSAAITGNYETLSGSSGEIVDGQVGYAGADFGTTDIEGLAGRSTSFGSFIGYQFTPHLAVEANIRRLADTTERFIDVRVVQMGLSLVGTLPLSNGLNVFGRVGHGQAVGF